MTLSTNTFWHEKLDVYHCAVRFDAAVDMLLSELSGSGAFRDHLRRASESVVENLVYGNSLRSASGKSRYFSIALGSAFECAACLDVAKTRQAIDLPTCVEHKRQLLPIARMLVGLIRAQERAGQLAEDDAPYDERPAEPTIFHHEDLRVYQTALEFVACADLLVSKHVSGAQVERKLDTLSTSIVLNIAEGNGRVGTLDHKNFIEIAYQATLKCASLLDRICARKVLPADERDVGKERLAAIAKMLAGMRGYWAGDDDV